MFAVLAPGVMRLRATIGNKEEPNSPKWVVRVADTPVERDSEFRRMIVGTLRVEGTDAWGEIDIYAQLASDVGIENSDIIDAFQGTDALETFYDIARMHLQPLVVTVSQRLEVPLYAPEAEIRLIEIAEPEESGPATSEV